MDGDTADVALMEQHLTQAFDILEDCYQLYLAAPDRLKNYSTKFSSSVSSSIQQRITRATPSSHHRRAGPTL
ncbi:hypothetical protein [Rothia aeria]|uniref:hypothetical protein n=1 Tax=Rothia aeria TaxID=172042 RepID=UPI00288C29D3|nr:hypothetical protein [Rothia aeria]